MNISSLPRPPVLTPRHAVFLDFDGTLAPLQDDPAAVHLSDERFAMLHDLAEALDGAVAVLTGRDVRDISERVPMGLWRAGNHGAAIAEPDQAPQDLPDAPPIVTAAARRAAALFSGLWVEPKGPVLALHLRGVPDAVEPVLASLKADIDEALGYKVEKGNGIIELKPKDANKGLALDALCVRDPFKGRIPIFFGDDTTDEDAHKAANAREGLSVKVGAGETAARYGLPDVEAMWQYLEESLGTIT